MTSSLLFAASFHPGVLVPIAVFVFVLIIVFISLYFRHERQRLWHETARIALEKGQPMPLPSDERDNCSYKHGPRSPLRDVRAALILLAVSIGLYLGLHEQGRQALIGSYITGGIGVALLLNAVITAVFTSKSTDTTARPPQA